MTEEPQLEREIKFPKVEHEGLRERLLELEAERLSAPSFEDNWILDRDAKSDGGTLRGRECVLRLRSDSHGARLTYKGPGSFEGRMKVRPEYETSVGDPKTMLALFEQLGYTVVRRYQKVREEWQLGGVNISLDHTPIGEFAEFEGDGAETVARRCGLDLDSSERRTYLRLYEEHRKKHPELPEDMVFPEDSLRASMPRDGQRVSD